MWGTTTGNNPLCVCVWFYEGTSVCGGFAQGFTDSHMFMSFCRVMETANVIQSTCFAYNEQIHYALGAATFHIQTDTRTNKRHSLLTHVTLHMVPPVSFYLKAWCPSYFLFCTWPQNSSHLACVPPIIGTRNTLVCLPEAPRAFQDFYNLMFYSSLWQMSVDLFCLPWWRVVGFSLKIHCSPPELEVILLQHLVMTQAAYQMHITCDSLSWGWPVPGKLDFVYFQTVPYIYMGPGCDDTPARWKCFQCLCPGSKGLMGTSTGDVTQEAPWANPLCRHLHPPTLPLVTLLPQFPTTLESVN